MSRNIFISHRHEEKYIADIVNNHIQLWGIPKKNIFQSSNSTSGTRIGGKLNDELRKALTEANLLIFIYTHGVYDWSYCMWECGVALGPNTETTNLVVFECAKETPKVFRPNVRVRVNQDEIIKFTHQFHKTPNFFAGQKGYNSSYSNDIIKKKGQSFYEDLIEVIPAGNYREKPLINLVKLSLTPKYVRKILQKKTAKGAYDHVHENLLIEESSPYCPEHFGFATFEKNMKWSEVVKGWQEEIAKSKAKKAKSSEAWLRELYAEIWRAIKNKQANPEGNSLITAKRKSKRQYAPLLCLMREYPDGKRLFNIYFYQKKG